MLSFWNIENIRHSHFYKDIQNNTGTKIGNKYQVKITSFFYHDLFLLCTKTLAENSVGRMKSLKLTVFVSYLTRKIVLNLM